MRLLLDTHILIWALINDKRLSRQARQMILDADNDVYYSAISVWEVALKHAARPENVKFSGREFAEYSGENGRHEIPHP